MHARQWLWAVVLAAILPLTPAFAQAPKSAPAAKGEQQPTLSDYEAQYRDKGWSRDIVELMFAIRVDRAAYDRVQQKYRHSDQRMITAAKDTRDLRLTGRQNNDDISNLSRDEVAALKKHALQGTKGGKK